ncbi:MAG: TnsA endonuclease N-terminal domain-containing protein [Legionella sp.]|uniref:TnsA endonuclease N-terminal domain-containing protein n=1 Tax=Legionella sp. TaxID=459 RepID=UPI002843216E|nr:TnsA endonuclease N-terminal domain-containing protein [Legionella sp.]
MTLQQGFFHAINPQKYKGDPTKIVYRSSWELRLMSRFDLDPSILEWQSEEFYIHYRCKTDNKIHKYFPDFRVKLRDKDGKIKTIIIEVKPLKQTKPPIQPKEKTPKQQKRFMTEMMTFAKNQSKFDAAKAYCKENGMEWMLMTEQEIYGKSN